MNKHQSSFIRIVGVIIFSFALLITIYCFAYPEKQKEILNNNALCNLQIGDTNFGEIGQQILSVQDECNKISLLAFLIKYNFLLYLLGIILFCIGLYSSLGRKK